MTRARVLLTLLLVVPLLSGCLGGRTTVALLIADGGSGLRTVDVEAFTDRVEATCDGCRVEVYDAEGNEAEQQNQVRLALADDAKMLVVEPVDPDAAADYAYGKTPVVSLVTLIPGSTRFVGLREPVAAQTAGQGTDLEAAREVVAGDRASMVHIPSQAMGEKAADVAVALLADNPTPGGEDLDGVQSWLYDASQVTIADLTTTLVGQGVVTIEELCEGATAKRCEKLGLR